MPPCTTPARGPPPARTSTVSTASGTNQLHGSLYGHRETNALNAAPFFFKNDQDIPEADKNPELHRYIVGGTVGGPILKNKLFGFLSYQHLHVSDQYIGAGFLNVPAGLSDTNRDAGGFANLANNPFGYCTDAAAAAGTCTQLTGANIDTTALGLFNSPALPGEPGKWLIPNDTGKPVPLVHAPLSTPSCPAPAASRPTCSWPTWTTTQTRGIRLRSSTTTSTIPRSRPTPTRACPASPSTLTPARRSSPSSTPFSSARTSAPPRPWGFIREKIYGDNEQPFQPQSIPGGSVGNVSIDQFGSTYFPGVSIYNVLGQAAYNAGIGTGVLNIGPNAEGQSSNTGVFQNRFQPSGNAIYTRGRHTLSAGLNYSYTQLNTIDHRTNTGTVATDDFSAFSQGFVTPGSSSTGFYVSSFLRGDANRYYRANDLGAYVQDKYQVTPSISLTAGLRYDWDGGLSEKYGRLFNFDSSLYSYDSGADTITNPGFIIAGNNANGTTGVSSTTLTGRQWGIAPRVGAAWSPRRFDNKVVVRTGFGMYYDRGELFSYFSPGYAIGTVTGGPFGVNQQLPFVNVQSCPIASRSLYSYYIPTCGGDNPYGPPNQRATDAEGDLAHPYGTAGLAAPNNPKASDLIASLPNLADIQAATLPPVSLGVYDRKNTLPYTYNYTLDVQWQPRPRPRHRTRLCRQSRPSSGHPGSVQPAKHRVAHQPHQRRAVFVRLSGAGPCQLRRHLQLRASAPAQRTALPRRLRGRQRRSPRALRRLCGRIHRLQSCRRRRLQRSQRAC